MKVCPRCGKTLPLSAFHVSCGRTASHCKTCVSEHNRAWYQANKERKRAAVLKWREQNATSYAESCAKYRDATRERQRAAVKAWDSANSERKNAHSAARRCRKRNAMPPWCDRAAIALVYEECARVTQATGTQHHVDHIVPLKGKKVSGLHVPWNLQVIPALDNRRKFTKFDPAL